MEYIGLTLYLTINLRKIFYEMKKLIYRMKFYRIQYNLCNFPALSKIRQGWAIYCHYDAIDPARRKFLHCLTLTKSSRSSSNCGEGIHGRIRVTWPEENFYRRPLNLVFFHWDTAW